MENNIIAKGNALIEARYDLGLNEQKVILYSISKIDRDNDNINVIRISIQEFVELIGTTTKRYTEFKEIAKSLITKTLFIEKEDSQLVTSWLASMDYLTDQGIIELEFSQKLIPYLLQLKERFTRYQLKNILFLKNKYSIRIYELMKQYENIGKRQFGLEELKQVLMVENQYERVFDFERFILKPAEDEINKHTDIRISYEKIKKKRKVIGISFTIESKDQEEKLYIEYLNECYDIKDLKEKMGIEKERFNAKQVMNLYEIAILKTESEEIDILKYIKLNYLFILQKGTVRNKYSYLVKAIEEDYAKAVAQLKIIDRYAEKEKQEGSAISKLEKAI